MTAAAAAIILVAGPSRAQKPKATPACNTAGQYVHSAHADEAAGKIPEAMEAYRSCAAQTSCGWLAVKCDAKLKTMQTKLPTIVLVANDESGQPVADVEVRIDGVLRTSKLTGVGIPIEPGLHEVTLSTGGAVAATEKVMVVEGQHDRLVAIQMHTPGSNAAVAPAAAPVATTPPAEQTSANRPASAEPAAAPSMPAESPAKSAPTGATSEIAAGPSHWALPRSPLPYTLAAVGVAGIAGGVLTTVWGNKDNTDLENKCSPNCSPSSLDHIKTMYVISDVSYGVGLASLAVATWLFASSRSAEKPASATLVDVHPLPSGALAAVTGNF